MDLATGYGETQSPFAARQGALVLPLGDRVLVYGGYTYASSSPMPVRPTRDAALLEIASGTWRSVADAPFSAPLRQPLGVWTGRSALVLGTPCTAASSESDAPQCAPGGVEVAAYSPARDEWSAATQLTLPVPGIDSGAAVEGTGLGWTGSDAVFQVDGSGPNPLLVFVDPATRRARTITAPDRVDTVCVTHGKVVAVRTGQIDERGGRRTSNAVAVAEPLHTYVLGAHDLEWSEGPETPKPSSGGAMSERVYCSAAELAYWPVMPAPVGFDAGGLWFDAERERWESLPALGRIGFPGEARIGAAEGSRVVWFAGSDRLFVLEAGTDRWSSVAAPVREPVALSTLSGRLLVTRTTPDPASSLPIGVLEPARYVATHS